MQQVGTLQLVVEKNSIPVQPKLVQSRERMTRYKKWIFPLQISSVKAIKSAFYADLVTFSEKNRNGNLHFLCSVNWWKEREKGLFGLNWNWFLKQHLNNHKFWLNLIYQSRKKMCSTKKDVKMKKLLAEEEINENWG